MSTLARLSPPRDALSLSRRRAVLELLGLRERRTLWGRALPALGWIGAGALLGAGSLLLFAPGLIGSRLPSR